MEIVFFKSDKSDTLVPVSTTADGKIAYRVLSSEFGLEPNSIRLCDVLFPKDDDLRSDASWTQIKNGLRVAGTKEDPVMVSGRPISEAPTGLSSGVPETFWKDLAEFLAEQKAKSKWKKSVQLSSVSRSMWDTIEWEIGLKMAFKEIDSNPEHSSDLPAFGWDDRQERSQADKYIPHLQNIASGGWMLIDAANHHPTLLSGFLGGWKLKGTTDVAFVHPILLKSDPPCGLKCIFKLKKDLGGGCAKAHIQTTICLVMANAFSHQFRPFAVLTDLRDFWSLYWMDGSTIYWYTFESRASAVGHIEKLLQDSDKNEMGSSEDGEDEGLEFIKKRRMYDPPGMDNLKDLVGLIPDEEILSARVQLSVQQLQKLLHIPLVPVVPDADVPWPQDSMYC